MSKIIKEIKSLLEDNQTVELIIYDTAKECMEAWCGCPLSEIKEWGGYDGKGGEYHLSSDEVLENIIKSGCWGFSRNKNAIHLWFDKNCNIGYLISLLAHERGHLLRPFYKDENKEEIKAERYGDTAKFAYDIACELLRMKVIKGETNDTGISSCVGTVQTESG